MAPQCESEVPQTGKKVGASQYCSECVQLVDNREKWLGSCANYALHKQKCTNDFKNTKRALATNEQDNEALYIVIDETHYGSDVDFGATF